MILKVKTSHSNWTLIDGISEVDYMSIYLKASEIKDAYTHVWIPDSFVEGMVKKISCKKHNNDFISILAEREVFLLNDEGKTIERIN